MTNAEINLQVAVQALKSGLLTGSSESFIDQIKDYDKYDLKKLSKKQYQFLNSIYKDFKYKI
jgi:hypothetical protein